MGLFCGRGSGPTRLKFVSPKDSGMKTMNSALIELRDFDSNGLNGRFRCITVIGRSSLRWKKQLVLNA